MNNKKLLMKIIIGLAGATVVFLILGLIFIGAGKIQIAYIDFDGNLFVGPKLNGFDLIKNSSVSEVLSSSSLSLLLEMFGLVNQLSLIRCGIVFAVIFTPMLFGFSAALFGYYYFKFIREPQVEPAIETTMFETDDEEIAVEAAE